MKIHYFMDARAVLFLLLVLCQCGNTALVGNPDDVVDVNETLDLNESYDALEHDAHPVCGNGIRENSEECDSETRRCNSQFCGGGLQECTAECTWGECIENRMHIIKGPMTVNEEVFTYRTNLVWLNGRFELFYTVREEDETDSYFAAYHSTLDQEGNILGSPFLFAPPFLIGYNGDCNVTALPAYSDFPFAVLFATSSDGVFLNFVDEEGYAVFDPGISLHDGHDSSTSVLLSSSDESLVAFMGRWSHGECFMAFLDYEGEMLNTRRPACWDEVGHVVYSRKAVTKDRGYTLFWFCRSESIQMQHFDFYGNPLGEPMTLISNILLDTRNIAAAYTGSQYGIICSEIFPEDYYAFADLKFMAVSSEGEVTTPPKTIGSVYGSFMETPDADMAWTGSEFGIAFSEPLSHSTDHDAKTIVKFIRLDASGTVLGDILDIDATSQSNNIKVAWNGTAYGVSWNEPFYPIMKSNLHFALVGCTETPTE